MDTVVSIIRFPLGVGYTLLMVLLLPLELLLAWLVLVPAAALGVGLHRAGRPPRAVGQIGRAWDWVFAGSPRPRGKVRAAPRAPVGGVLS